MNTNTRGQSPISNFTQENNEIGLCPLFLVVWQLDRLLAVLAGMFVLPTLLHALPGFGPGSGMIWLPIFYAPLIAMIYCRPHVGILAALIAPLLNSLLTGLPEGPMVWMLSVDLLLFSAIGMLFSKMFKTIPLTGACAYIAAKFIAVVVLGIVPVFLADLNRITAFWKIISGALPGLTVLLLINVVILWQKREQARG